MRFTQDERFLMLLYSPGDRPGLILRLHAMCSQLAPDETELAALTESTLAKLERLTDEEFARIDPFAEL